jgi:hypothetical protein
MNLMLMAMVTAILLGMVFRKHDAIWRAAIAILSIGVTLAYFIFADRLM